LKLYRDFRRDTDVDFQPWRAPASTSKTNGAPHYQAGQRCMHCQTVIRALITEKYYPFEEYHRFAFLKLAGKPTLVYQTSGQASGVTFSDTFRTESLCVYTETTDQATGLPRVSARMFMYVQFLKFSIVKGKIKSESLKELTAGMARFHELTIEHLREAPSAAAYKKSLSDAKTRGGQPQKAALQAVAAAAKAEPLQRQASAVSSPQTQPPSAFAHAASPLTAARGAPAVAQGPAIGGIAAFVLPKLLPLRIATLVMILICVLYVLKALWNAFWFSPETVPIAAAAVGALVNEPAASELHTVAAMQTLANFVAYIVRPAVAAMLWAWAARMLPWLEAVLESAVG
jgi:hypothetical protein